MIALRTYITDSHRTQIFQRYSNKQDDYHANVEAMPLYPPSISRLLHSIYFFIAFWILVSLIAFDVIERNRSAKITATLGGQQLPQSAIEQQEQSLGVSPKYWDQQYSEYLLSSAAQFRLWMRCDQLVHPLLQEAKKKHPHKRHAPCFCSSAVPRCVTPFSSRSKF